MWGNAKDQTHASWMWDKTSILPLSHISGLLDIRFLFNIQSRLSPHTYLLQFIFWPSICNFFYGNRVLRGYSQLCAAVGYVFKPDVWTPILSFQQCNSFLIFVFHDLDTRKANALLLNYWPLNDKRRVVSAKRSINDYRIMEMKGSWKVLITYFAEHHVLVFLLIFTIRLFRGKYNR